MKLDHVGIVHKKNQSTTFKIQHKISIDLLLCAILKIWKQNLPLKCADVFFTRCLPIAFTPTSAILFTSELEIIFSPNCSKFAVECDWNRKNSQNVQIWGFFGEVDRFFRKIILKLFQNRYMWQIFSRMRLKCYFFLKMSFHLSFEVFFGENQKIKSWKSWKI